MAGSLLPCTQARPRVKYLGGGDGEKEKDGRGRGETKSRRARNQANLFLKSRGPIISVAQWMLEEIQKIGVANPAAGDQSFMRQALKVWSSERRQTAGRRRHPMTRRPTKKVHALDRSRRVVVWTDMETNSGTLAGLCPSPVLRCCVVSSSSYVRVSRSGMHTCCTK